MSDKQKLRAALIFGVAMAVFYMLASVGKARVDLELLKCKDTQAEAKGEK